MSTNDQNEREDQPSSEDVGAAINDIVGTFKKQSDIEAAQLFEKLNGPLNLIEAIDFLKNKEFLLFSHLTKRKFENMIEYIIENTLDIKGNYKLLFLVKNYNFVSSFLRELYYDNEGFFACADKAKVAVKRIYYDLKDGKRIGKEQFPSYAWPNKVLTDHDELMRYFEGLEFLYYGRPQKYLASLVEINKKNELLVNKDDQTDPSPKS